jgi:hypothetical protein
MSSDQGVKIGDRWDFTPEPDRCRVRCSNPYEEFSWEMISLVTGRTYFMHKTSRESGYWIKVPDPLLRFEREEVI